MTTTFKEARDIVNTLIGNTIRSTAMKNIFGYVPITFWNGADYNKLPTDKVSITIGHNQLRESIEKFVGGRNLWNTFGAIIEVRCPTSILNGANKLDDVVVLMQDGLCARSDNGVDLKGCRLSFQGVEDSCFVVGITVRYDFFTRLTK